ncbi:MAG TPA: glucokinase [Gammaproteobacteria bacterium]
MNATVRVLAADVGGTNTRLLLADSDGITYTPLREQHYASADWLDLLPILQDFFATDTALPQRACLAIAGPITGDAHRQQAQVTNLPWLLDGHALGQALGIPRVKLINDFAAVAHGIAALRDSDIITLQTGEPRAYAPRAVLGAGTGLGQALLVQCGSHYEVLPTEGGHVDFAPQSDEQWHLLRTLQRDYGHVSYERLLSGAGLVFIYRFLQQRRSGAIPELIVQACAAGGDPAAAISQTALAGTDPIAAQALHEFIRIYGAQAGNLALGCLPFGGLYVAGGIAPKILSKLLDGTFIAAFNAKGRMETITRRIPVHVVTHANPGLLGAALYAGRDGGV